MELTRKFNQLNKGDSSIAGGKGASLGEMLQAGIPVPDGFVVLSTTFDEFIKKSGLAEEIDAILDSVDHKAVHTIDAASEKIQELIKHADMPDDIAADIFSQFDVLDAEYVAVRSSATAEDGADHAWAGQLDSYLNTTRDNVLKKVQDCWASLFTPRAIFYRFEKGLHTTVISVAVVVQKMVNSEISGIAFSVHPVTEDRNQLIIEAGLGLGEAIVSGSVTPDSYVVEKEPRRILDITVNHQNKALYRKEGGGNDWIELSDEKADQQILIEDQINELSNIIVTIENHYGFPCDIEWAFEQGKFYIVQSRPITTLSAQTNVIKIDLQKAYTRDTTLLIQQGWHDVVANAFEKERGIKNPHIPPVVHYMNDGVIEIWENEASTQWFLNTLQTEITRDHSFISTILDRYEKDLVEIKSFWSHGPISDAEALITYVDRVFDVMSGFVFMYYIGMDERTPSELRERALKMRDADTYFDSNDKLMRQSLIAVYPELKGIESGVLRSELRNPPTPAILQERKKNFVMVGEREAFLGTLREYQSVHPELYFHIEIPPADNSTLVGQVGNKGYAKGIVRILKRKEQISEAQDGDIIVSTMTTPDFIPAMQKAAAIITDEGGVTCHAAIVARELNKPCVIGTKFATEILKDGDEVEVDADNGVVRIFSSKKATTFEKSYVRDNALMSFEIWNRNQTKNVGQTFFMDVMSFILDATHGVTTVYYKSGIWDDLAPSITAAMSDPKHFDEIVKEYDTALQYLEPLWKENKAVSKEEFTEFIKQSVLGWTGMSIGYDIPNIKTLSDEQKTFGLSLRERGIEYFENMDHIVVATLKSLYPEIGELVRYISLEEFENNSIPSTEELRKREDHFVYFKDTLYVGVSFEEWKKQHPEVEVVEEKPEATKYTELKGTTAMKGQAKGIVRIVMSKSRLDEVQEGDILVTSMTTPDFLPAMLKAAAFVTDEGGVTCHAAIVARELGKPCVIGTKFATQVLKDGDEVEVDADSGIVKILNKTNDLMAGMDPVEISFKEYLPLLWMYPFCSAGFSENYRKYVNTDVSVLYKIIQGELTDYQSADAPKRVYESAKEIFQNTAFWEDLFKTYSETVSSLQSLSKSLLQKPDLSSLSTADIISNLEMIRKGTEVLYPMTNMCYFFTLEFENHITDEITSLLPLHPTYSLRFREQANTIKEKFFAGVVPTDGSVKETYTSNPEFRSAMDLLTKEFQYLTSVNLTTRTPESFFADIANATEIEKQDASSLTANQKIVAECLFYKDEISTYLIPFIKHGFMVLWTEAAKRLNTTAEGIECLTISEIVNYLNTPDESIQSLISKRREFTWSYHIAFNDNIPLFEGKEQEVIFDQKLKELEVVHGDKDMSEIKEFTGKIGNKGNVQGSVTIVHSAEQISTFPEGNILVAVYTAPELVPIMKKAKAIVTDTGGIACHAAIVARELGIPCIVGTKIATKILSDGDVIEVDANTGTVKIIS